MNLQEMKNLPKSQQEEIFNRLSSIRKKAKVVTYSATYGVGKAKLSRTTGMPEKQAEALLKAFWEINWAVKEVADTSTVRTLGGKMWLKNPVSGFWISLRFERDRFSSLNQSTGVFCFDSWLAQCWVRGIKGVFQSHDEVLVVTSDSGQTEQLMKESIQVVNNNLKLNVKLGIDSKLGPTYASVH